MIPKDVEMLKFTKQIAWCAMFNLPMLNNLEHTEMQSEKENCIVENFKGNHNPIIASALWLVAMCEYPITLPWAQVEWI